MSCIEEMPDLVQVAQANTKDLDVLFINYDLQIPRADRSTVVARVQAFMDGRQWNQPVLIFGAPDTDALNARFDLPGPIPVTLAFDKAGRVVDREDGPCDKQRFEELALRARGI